MTTAIESVDQLVLYDDAVVDWVKTCPLKTVGDTLGVTFATPEVAFASMARQIGVDPNKDPGFADLVPLPFASVARTNVQFDPTRFRGNNTTWRRLGWAPGGDAIRRSKFPRPVNITYNVEVWARTRATLNTWQVWSAGQFESFEILIPIDFSAVDAVWKSKVIPLVDEGIVDNSELETEDGQNRILRATQTITAQGWIFPEIEYVPVIRKIQIDVHGVVYPEPLGIDAETVWANPDKYPLLEKIIVSKGGDS